MGSIRRVEVLRAMVLIAWGGLLLFVALTLPLDAFPGEVNPDFPGWAWLIAPLLGLFMLEGGRYTLRLAREIREDRLSHQPGPDAIAQAANAAAYVERWTTLFKGLVFLALPFLMLAGLLVGLAYNWTNGQPGLNRIFYTELAVVLVYLILRIPFLMLLKKVTGGIAPGRPFRVEADGLVFPNLMRVMGGSKNPRWDVRIGFDDLEEIRDLSDMEAGAFLQYQIGPNLTLGAAAAVDQYRYFNKQIPRPRFYAVNALRPNGRTLLLRGPDLFYLIAVDGDPRELAAAFEKHRSEKLRIPPIPPIPKVV
ncbi:MAG: hypothetical protein EHM61_22805 [Acidobacteria bacterium]|nr:MAG: hypothetical protein EHM61_22805 [Acidobacteriota bacterium]